MAHYFIFPEKDSTIYSHPTRNNLNTGIDEILSISNEASSTHGGIDFGFFLIGGEDVVNGLYYPSRVLIKFNNTNISNVISSKVGNSSYSASLKLFQTEHTGLALSQHFEVFPLSADWDNGTGRYSNSPPTRNGVSWLYKDNNTTQTRWATSSFGAGITASFHPSSSGGGTWYYGTGYEVKKSYNYGDELDLNFDVTPIVQKYYNNTIPNYGFILKRSSSQEFTTEDNGTLNFFSLDTHTIYPPFLDISWDDSNYTATENIMTSGDLFITLRNNKGVYRVGEEVKFRLNVRELYPTRTFTTSSNYLKVNYFTSASYYSLIDYATEEVVIPFDNHTKMSSDSEGMYFKLYMNGLQEERYYKLLFKHHNDDGITIYNDNYYFKITKS